jgi:phospholipid-transporting ATPase
MEIVKFAIGKTISEDKDMYYEFNDTPACARTSSLVDELGLIDYVFSDKSGTLTCNMMEFKLLMVAGIAYADIVPDNRKPIKDSNGNYTGWFEYKRLIEKDETSDDCKEFLQILAVCHTVRP